MVMSGTLRLAAIVLPLLITSFAIADEPELFDNYWVGFGLKDIDQNSLLVTTSLEYANCMQHDYSIRKAKIGFACIEKEIFFFVDPVCRVKRDELGLFRAIVTIDGESPFIATFEIADSGPLRGYFGIFEDIRARRFAQRFSSFNIMEIQFSPFARQPINLTFPVSGALKALDIMHVFCRE